MEENNSDKNHPIINNNQFRAGKGSFSPTIPECQFFIATDDEQEQGKIIFKNISNNFLVRCIDFHIFHPENSSK